MLVNMLGVQRFKILEVVEERPVLVCDVEFLPDAEDDTADTPEVGSMRQLFKRKLGLPGMLPCCRIQSQLVAAVMRMGWSRLLGQLVASTRRGRGSRLQSVCLPRPHV
jgi:hypothetical protein